MKYFIIGSYGCGNCGDDAILAGIIKKIRQNNEMDEITVFASDTEYIERTFSVKTVRQALNQGFRLSLIFKFSFLELFKTIKKSDVIVVGGGSLMHDLRVYNMPFYYMIVKFAKMQNKKVILHGIGVTIMRTKLGKFFYKSILKNADSISIRDNEGAKEKFGYDNKIRVTCDPAFNLEKTDAISEAEFMKIDEFNMLPERYIGVTVSGWFKSENFWKYNKKKSTINEDYYINTYVNIIDYIIEKYKKDVVFITTVMPHDQNMGHKIKQRSKNLSNIYVLSNLYTPFQLLKVLSKADFIFAMRFHSIILSTIMNVPYCVIGYDKKVTNFMREQGLDDFLLELNDLNTDRAIMLIEKIINNNTEIKNKLKEVDKNLNYCAQKDIIN